MMSTPQGGKPQSGKKAGRGATIKSSGDEVCYPIPQASAVAWAEVRRENGHLNPGLIFDRFAPDWSSQATLKKTVLEEVQDVANKRADVNLLKAWNARWEACAQAASAEPFPLKTDWRFVAGLGRKGALEVGFTFHRYGFPILPGSSVKGLARAWALIEIARQVINPASLKELDDILSADGEKDSKERKPYEEWRKGQQEEVQKLADDFRAIFGTTAQAGRTVFFDAIPAAKPMLELDIMNPHYPKYYSGDEYPTDWQSPVPVYFLTVARNTEFRFAVGWRGTLDDEGQRLRALAKGWLVGGLTELGAGAKTSAGYGYFVAPPADVAPQPVHALEATSPHEETPPSFATDPHQRSLEEFVRQLESLAVKDVAGQIARFVDRWRQTQAPDSYRLQMAQAILDKIEAAGRTKKSQEKGWFQELQAFVSERKANKE